MFSWGENCQQGFWTRDRPGPEPGPGDGVHFVNVSDQIRGLSAGHSVLVFVQTNGKVFIIRTNEAKDGRRVRGKQKFVKCEEKIQAVSCGDDVVTLLSDRGKVLCVDTTRSPFSPRSLEIFCKFPVSQVACGSQHSVALTRDGQVYTWGQDSRGQLGLGRERPSANSPQHVKSLSAAPLVQIAAGGEQSFALSVSGAVFGWGRNDRGQLGLGDATDRNTPTPVDCLNKKKTIHISCGKDHTAIFTKDGAVFTFGSGQHGQLGHNSFRDELRPRLVAELLGAKVTKISCGRHHTLVLTDSMKIYSFGCSEQGQLGRGDKEHPSVPLPVQLPQDSSDGPKIRNIFAGGNCSFATCASDKDVDEKSNTDSCNGVTQHRLDDMIDRWTSECESETWKKIKQEIYRSFSSASCWNKSFLEQRKEKHFQTSSKYPGLNLLHAKRAFKKLVQKDCVLAEVEAAVVQLLQSFNKTPMGVEGLRLILLLNELLYVIQKHKRPQSTKLTEAFAAAVLSLSADRLQVIGDWWSSLSTSTMRNYVNVWKQALTVILSLTPVPRNSGVRNLLVVLQYMYNANSRTPESKRIPESDFFLSIGNEFLMDEVKLWNFQLEGKRAPAEPLILCSFPIVMDLQTKKRVFDLHTMYSQLKTISFPLEDFFSHWACNPEEALQRVSCELHLKRVTILDDTFQKLADVDPSDWKRPLAVYFDENGTYDAVHLKDLFHEVFHEMMSVECKMFMFNHSKTLAWFSSRLAQEDQRYFLCGVLCGLAFYNHCIIHLPFPMALFKKLLGMNPSLEDMMEFSPQVGKTLQSILEDYTDAEINELDMDHLIVWDETEVDLDPQQPEKPVTGQNKKEFVDAYVNYAFNTSVENVFSEFKRGFFQLWDPNLLKLFQPKELKEVLVGKDFYDWERLKKNTKYDRGYHVDHPNIRMFWEVFDELTEDQKKTFLWFLTGFEKVPILHLETIAMTIRVKQRKDEDEEDEDHFYPETHTCFSYLDLPLYSTRDIMKTKLAEVLRKRGINK
ncbi:probable E3 ubiquitin-protein ligase HERC3 [Echeneis naucrates]|uniref:probable E3 ubiquitin-protein ligase HERC3 n=1 Tax=Echeneis naucrates TaxID=173247 RepID=UPI0011134F3A|nr:probable E3 ubiquitin-protein ligase HERC3 [Echeneis naucrates]